MSDYQCRSVNLRLDEETCRRLDAMVEAYKREGHPATRTWMVRYSLNLALLEFEDDGDEEGC